MLTKNEIKYIHELRLKKKRKIHNAYIIEGEKMVAEALQEIPEQITNVYCLEEFAEKHGISVAYEIISERELKTISELTTPNQALAILKIEDSPISDSPFYLALDEVQDPGNLGTIIRLADWFGVQEIICSKNCVDVYNTKVIQATMGSVFRVKIHYVDLMNFIQEKKLPVYGALLNGKNIYQQTLEKRGILLMGNEGNGINEELQKVITHPIMIPKFGNAESLNVSMATGIILSEFSRNQ